MSDWRVIYTAPERDPQVVGGTGMPSESFALGVYEGLEVLCRRSGGKVELLDGERVVAVFPVPGSSDGSP